MPSSSALARYRTGYYRTRPRDLVAQSFQINGHRFETGQRDLWVTLEGDERIDRLKVTRGASSRSAQDGYPAPLLTRRGIGAPSADALMQVALFWLTWRATADAARFPNVNIGPYERQLETAAAES